MTDTAESESETAREHLAEIEDGCGCVEVWEHLSEHRNRSE